MLFDQKEKDKIQRGFDTVASDIKKLFELNEIFHKSADKVFGIVGEDMSKHCERIAALEEKVFGKATKKVSKTKKTKK